MDNLSKYFRATAAELKQVAWPSTQQTLLYTGLVIAISVLVALYAGAFDYLFNQGINWLVTRI